MKRLFLSIVAMVAIVAGASAMSLKEAFAALSNIPNVSLTKPDYNLPATIDAISDARIAAAYQLDRQQIFLTGNTAFAILNQVPLAYMINGGSNNLVGAFVYTTPAGPDKSEILIAVMSGYYGSVTFVYGTVDNAVRDAIQNAPMQMNGAFLSIEGSMPDGNDFNITVSKAR